MTIAIYMYLKITYLNILFQWDPRTDPQHIPCIVPWQGPFHVSLNIQESTVLLYRPFFASLYKYLFGQNKTLPKRPKSEKIALLIAATFGGWTVVPYMVQNHFGGYFKDPQYLLLLHLFDEVAPLVFYYYVSVFRGGEFDQWLHTMLRISIQFIVFRRRIYDKATLCHLSDILYHLKTKPRLAALTTGFLKLCTHRKEG
jgi:hypothetical protein